MKFRFECKQTATATSVGERVSERSQLFAINHDFMVTGVAHIHPMDGRPKPVQPKASM